MLQTFSFKFHKMSKCVPLSKMCSPGDFSGKNPKKSDRRLQLLGQAPGPARQLLLPGLRGGLLGAPGALGESGEVRHGGAGWLGLPQRDLL